ncbi:hypothetical protein GGI35DRAFT_308992 [Trichoderma velutinum]
MAIGAKDSTETPSTIFRKKQDPWVTALIESSDETLLDGGQNSKEEVAREIQKWNNLSGQHSRASDAARICSRTGKSKQVPLRPKGSDTLDLAHKIDDLLERMKPIEQEQSHPTRSLASSHNPPRVSTQYSPRGQPAQPVSAHQSPQRQPAQPVSAQRSPQGRPAQPASAQNSPQGQFVQPASGQIPLEWSPEQSVSRRQYNGQSNHPLRQNPPQLTASPQRQRQRQQQEEEEEEGEEGPMNSHQQEHCKRMLQEANLWPLARLEEALASQTLAYVPEMGPGNNISTSNQVENLGDVVESAEDNLDADVEAATDTENAATKKSPFTKMRKWYRKSRSQ